MEKNENGARHLRIILTTVLILLGIGLFCGASFALERPSMDMEGELFIAAVLSFGFALIGNRS